MSRKSLHSWLKVNVPRLGRNVKGMHERNEEGMAGVGMGMQENARQGRFSRGKQEKQEKTRKMWGFLVRTMARVSQVSAAW